MCVCFISFYSYPNLKLSSKRVDFLANKRLTNDLCLCVCIPPCGADDKLDDFSLPVYMRKIVSVKKYIVVV